MSFILSVVYFIVMLGECRGTRKFELKEKKFERNGINFKTFCEGRLKLSCKQSDQKIEQKLAQFLEM